MSATKRVANRAWAKKQIREAQESIAEHGSVANRVFNKKIILNWTFFLETH